MKSKKLSHAHLKSLQAQLRRGQSKHAELGRKYGISRQRVQQIAKVINAPTHANGMEKRRQTIIHDLRSYPDKSRSQIARDNKTWPSSVCAIAKEIGMKSRAEIMSAKRLAIRQALSTGSNRYEVSQQLRMPMKLVNEVGKAIGK
ncbi:hypothetical protein [Xanthomonas cannabis]|uniref:hypothetical protein n=1 Tax=Xanthomonas cannabis TaxID=1885674 RepID=UPI0011119589|nr:hypothetical protein [Xanthomonas cannabis]